MIKEISIHQIGRYTEYFQGPQIELVLGSIVEGNSAAQLWMASQTEGEDAFLLWDKGNNVLYISGSLASEGTREEFAYLIISQIKETAVNERKIYFSVHHLTGSSQEQITDLIKSTTLYKKTKLLHVFKQQKVGFIPSPQLKEVQIALIDEEFLKRTQLKNHQLVISEINCMWPTVERFIEYGFGSAAILEDMIICWCTSEYVNVNKCGIGIETLPEFQRKGIATSTAAHFVSYCLRHAMVPLWECASDNTASIKVSEKVGFELVHEATFWAGIFQS